MVRIVWARRKIDLDFLTDAPVVRRILGHLREPPARAPPSGAHEPMSDDDGWVDLVE